MRIVVTAADPAERTALRQAALGVGLECGAADAVPLAEGRARSATAPAPALIVVGVGAEPDPALALVAELAPAGVPVYAAGPVAEARVLHAALSAGARGYLDRAALRTELARVAEQVRQAGGTARRGALVAVTAAHPGAGVTTTVLGLGFALAGEGGGSVAIAEVCPPVPALALRLAAEPKHSVAQLLAWPDRIDASMVREAAVRHPGGVDLLAFPAEEPAPAPAEGAAAALQLILRVVYDWSVLDYGFGAGEPPADLRRCDRVVLVIRPDVPGIRLARRYARALADAGVPAGALLAVVNRYDEPGQLPWRKIEEALKLPVAAWVPDSPRGVNRATNEGRPIADGATARRFRDLARAIRGTA